MATVKSGYGLGTAQFSSDGTTLVISDGNTSTVQLWRRDGVAKWGLLRVMKPARHPDAATQCGLTTAFTPDGKQIFVFSLRLGEGNESGFDVEKWDMLNGNRLDFPTRPMTPEADMIGNLFFVVGASTFCIQIAGPKGGAVGIDIASGKTKYNLPVLLTCASISPDGRLGASVAVDWGTGSDPLGGSGNSLALEL